jgi:uncharacterized protein (DUF433 family)
MHYQRTDLRRYSAGVEPLRSDDDRIAEPLYSIAEAALFLGRNPSTFREWVRGRDDSRPIVTAVDEEVRGRPVIPFIGLAEGTAAALLKSIKGISTQYIRRVVAILEAETGVAHALASKNLHLHGAQVLYEYVQEDETARLVEVVSQNAVFRSVVADKLKRISYGSDGWASRLVLPTTKRRIVVANPDWAAGQPITVRGGARVIDLVERFRGGESPTFIAQDFGVPENDVLDILRAFYKPAAEAA